MALRATKLPLDAKIYIIRSLASFESPSGILAHLQQTFAVQISRKALRHYDPVSNPKLDADLMRLFYETRQTFWHQYEAQPLDSLDYRQRLRMEIYDEAGNNHALKAAIVDSAIRDAGGSFSNRRCITGADDAAMLTVGKFVEELGKRVALEREKIEDTTEPSTEPA